MPAMSAQQVAVVVWPDELVERHGTALQPDAPAGTLPRPYPHVNSRNRMAAFGRTNIRSWLASVKGAAQASSRSRSAPRTHTNHHAPALLPCCDGLLREGSWWALWWGSLDGMQGVRVAETRAVRQ